jgi:hypothetical protein
MGSGLPDPFGGSSGCCCYDSFTILTERLYLAGEGEVIPFLGVGEDGGFEPRR